MQETHLGLFRKTTSGQQVTPVYHYLIVVAIKFPGLIQYGKTLFNPPQTTQSKGPILVYVYKNRRIGRQKGLSFLEMSYCILVFIKKHMTETYKHLAILVARTLLIITLVIIKRFPEITKIIKSVSLVKQSRGIVGVNGYRIFATLYRIFNIVIKKLR